MLQVMLNGELDSVSKTTSVDKQMDDNSNISDSVAQNGKHRKLILHFDIRNTVIVADSITNVSVEQALNSFLTGVTWGKESDDGRWEWYSDKLSLTPPSEDTITYYKHLEKMLVKTPCDRAKLRLQTGDFTQSDIGKSFLPYFNQHMNLLRWTHGYEQKHECLTMKGMDGQPYHYLLPAIYKCIHQLYMDNRDFAIVFRTYGLDAENVIASLAHGLEGNHPGFNKRVAISVNRTPGFIHRSDGQCIKCQMRGNEDSEELLQTCTGDREVYNVLSECTGIVGFKDDFVYWQSNQYHHTAGKPLFIDPFDCNVHHIIFDDNIRTFEDDNIVDVRLFETKGAKIARSLSKVEAASFENVCMVQADLIESIESDEYYINAVNKCEQNYSKYLMKWHGISRGFSLTGIHNFGVV
ncbi:hypothetical protein ACJMK2_015928 [Sinanodonta woodiana]|uniref:Uncharacterized protein n=1 Tax=Sinanodonta woodiana TaxID=1069815 RepID=A0ABD3UVM8_SINWO